MIFKQIFFFLLYAIFSFGITKAINCFFKSKRILSFILPILLLFSSIILLILGLTYDQDILKYCALVACAFIGSLIASIVFFTDIR